MTAGAKVRDAAIQAGGHRIVIISAKAAGSAAGRPGPGPTAHACCQPAVASRIHSQLVPPQVTASAMFTIGESARIAESERTLANSVDRGI